MAYNSQHLSYMFSTSFLAALLLFPFIQNFPTCSSYKLPPSVQDSTTQHFNHTAISDGYRVLNRRALAECPDPNPFLKITAASTNSGGLLSDDDFINVTVTGVVIPQTWDWVAMISPSHSDVETCPLSKLEYAQTGDLEDLPLLCHYPVKLGAMFRTSSSPRKDREQNFAPVLSDTSLYSGLSKAQHVSSDPGYLSCQKKECSYSVFGKCLVHTCSATLSFHVVNIRTDIQFVLFEGGFDTPCILARSNILSFANPNKPLHGHISSTDSTATSMKVRWVSGDKQPQKLQYGDGKTEISKVSTFTRDDMCTAVTILGNITSPAQDFGWHDPGYIHSAVMTGLTPSSTFSYKYGSDLVGWSDEVQFKTPPAGGSDELKFLIFGDMGKTPLDASVEHYIQPGALSVIKAMTEEVEAGNVDSIFHIGDISYATGFLVEWDYFLNLITPMASRLSYMTAIGNHESNYPGSRSRYQSPDSGGECGVPYETYFPMPNTERDKPWYSIEQGSIHFTVISTEHDWTRNSEQYQWMQKDLASVNRTRTPWLIFTGHRALYTSGTDFGDRDPMLAPELESLLVQNKVDVAFFAHVHNYERLCCVYQDKCVAMPKKDQNGIDTYDLSEYRAPVQAVIGMAGFTLQTFKGDFAEWSLLRISEYGYVRCNATRNELRFEFVNPKTKQVDDSFRVVKDDVVLNKLMTQSADPVSSTLEFK